MSPSPGAENIEFKCSSCNATITATISQSGTMMGCSSCHALNQVPAAPAPVPAAPQEVPAPAVVLNVDTVSPSLIAEPVTAHVGDVPLSPAPAQSSQDAIEIAAVGSQVATDPNARATPGSVTPGIPARLYEAPANRTTPPKPSSRKLVAAFSLMLFLSAGSVVGVSLRNGMVRNELENEVKVLMDGAESAFAKNQVNGAVENGEKALAVIGSAPTKLMYVPFETRELDPEKTRKWSLRVKHFNQTKTEADQLDGIFAEVAVADGKQPALIMKDPTIQFANAGGNADAVLASVRTKLEDKKLLYGPVTPDNQPLVAKVELLLAEVANIELKRKVQKLHNSLESAEVLYRDAKIEDAAAKATDILAEMIQKPQVQDVELEKRLTVLRKRADDLKKAQVTRLVKNGEYSKAKTELQKQISSLDEKNDDYKPLIKRISQLRNDVIQEEKRSRKLSADEAGKLRAIVNALSNRDKSFAAGELEGDSIGLSYNGKPLRLGFQQTALSQSFFFESAGNRFTIEPRDLERRTNRVVAHVIALGEAMKKAGVASDDLWSAVEEAPFVSARHTGDDGREYIFLNDRLYIGKPLEKSSSEKEVEADFAKKAEALAKAVENDSKASEEVRRVVAVAVRATYKEADWYDHLPGQFVRQVVDEGYIEQNMPGAGERLKAEFQAYHEAYGKISNPHPRFNGLSEGGDEAVELRTFEDHSIWRMYNKSSNTTSFAIKNPDDERNCLFILYDYPGKLNDFPSDTQPKTVRMTHQAVGVTATYDLAADKMTYDQSAWDLAVQLETPNIPREIRKDRGLGEVTWALPPHVLMVTPLGDTKAIITPYGRVDIQDFSKIAEPAKRQEAMDKFLDKLAVVLPTANYLHLYFRYFFEYILDSPITSNANLLGSRAHSGDIHQTAYQSLMRLMGGRYVGDCDDLAEFFMNITRRQSKLSYVMALPQHAACGWAEKTGEGSEAYTFYVIDTGPPRIFKARELDKSIESAFRAYDESRTMRFDPKSLGFLFRFNGEPTRTPYYLSSRMYTDREYGEAMEKVQSYWHFHFYALGIKTMSEMIKKGDRVPENHIELAGLYGQVREVESSIQATNEALKQFGPEDKLSRMGETFRIATLWREEHEDQKAYDAVKDMIEELHVLQSDPQSLNYFSMRLQLMGLLVAIDRPWEAWDVVKRDMYMFAQRGMMKIEHAGGLTGVYKKMKEMEAEGKQLSADDKEKTRKLDELLKWFYTKALFEPEDDFNDYMRKYAFVGMWYAGKFGQKRLVEELLKPGPFPDPAKPRNHPDRKDPEAEDWKWIRLALPSYSLAVGDALDPDDPPAKWRRDEAVKLSDAMMKAAEEARKFGSLSSSEFQLLSSRVFRAFLMKDWADLEKVLQEVKQRDWARLTSDIAETFGRCARFVTPEEFGQQYRMFTKYVTSRPSYFTVVYEAYRADSPEHAAVASKIALEISPKDEDMKREAEYLNDLVKKKLEKKAKQSEAPASTPPASTKAESSKPVEVKQQ